MFQYLQIIELQSKLIGLFFVGGNVLSILRDHSANISFIVVIPRVARHDYFNSDLISLHRSAAAKDKLMRSHFRENRKLYCRCICDNILYDIRDYFRPSDVAYSRVCINRQKRKSKVHDKLSWMLSNYFCDRDLIAFS